MRLIKPCPASTHGPPGVHQILPQSAEAEMAVLGSIFLAPTTVMDLCREQKITPSHFYTPAHCILFEVFHELHAASKPIDLILTVQFLNDRGLMDKAGGPGHVAHLYGYVPTAANAGYYIDILREKYVLRETIRICMDLTAQAYEPPEDVITFLAGAQARIGRIATQMTSHKSSR